MENIKEGKKFYNQVEQKLSLAYADVIGDMHIVWLDLDKGFLAEGDNFKRYWYPPRVDHKPLKGDHMV